MKSFVLTIYFTVATLCGANGLSFHHTFATESASATTMLHGKKAIFVANRPSIDAAAISDFEVSYQPFSTNRHTWTHRISIRFTDAGRRLWNQMIREKDVTRDYGSEVAVLLNGHVIFLHNFEPLADRNDGLPDIEMAVSLSDADYEDIQQRQKK